MDKSDQRQLYKSFGQNITSEFYTNKRDLFPNTFLGYHAGVDLESFDNEKADKVLVPVYAITNGTIIYKGNLKGYGGVILLRLNGINNVALYGHVKLPAELNVNDKITVGTKLTHLGDNFSSETSGERKHLHFAILKGSDLYFRGHEPNEFNLNKQWEDPIKFLQKNNTVQNPTPDIAEGSKQVKKIVENNNFIYNLINQFTNLFVVILNATKNLL